MFRNTYIAFINYPCYRNDHTMQDGYPARLKKIYILKAPLWFKGPLKIVSPFLKRKFLERVCTDFNFNLPKIIIIFVKK